MEQEYTEAEDQEEDPIVNQDFSGLFSSDALKPSGNLMPSNNLFGGLL